MSIIIGSLLLSITFRKKDTNYWLRLAYNSYNIVSLMIRLYVYVIINNVKIKFYFVEEAGCCNSSFGNIFQYV